MYIQREEKLNNININIITLFLCSFPSTASHASAPACLHSHPATVLHHPACFNENPGPSCKPLLHCLETFVRCSIHYLFIPNDISMAKISEKRPQGAARPWFAPAAAGQRSSRQKTTSPTVSENRNETFNLVRH